ncbi:MAG: Cof-type HAD-IIB family hydrolase [Clostridiales bacterium]|jgi:Cof subfamily protein (haloacid dehalogenase superfamily)|nr:Cof-type HAD-IIB family hydrolase [Clostridiales bacterium]
MYKLLMTDLDGTLLDDAARIPPKNAALIKEATARGIKVVISSGRSFLSLARFEEALGLMRPGGYGIAFNGAVVYETDSRRHIRDLRLENHVFKLILAEVRAFNTTNLVYISDRLIIDTVTALALKYREKSGIPLTMAERLEDIDTDISKFILRGPEEELSRVQRRLAPIIAGKCNMFFSARDLLEFTKLGATKGEGLKFLAEYLQLDPSEIIAVGDQDNDISMLRAAGLGVAVANATDAVKNAADCVTRAINSECALCEVIEKFLQNEYICQT